MKKRLSLILALLMLLPALAACGESKENNDASETVTAAADAQTPSAETPAEEETEPDILTDL